MTGLNDFRNHPCNTLIGTTFCVRYNCDGAHRGPIAEAHSRLLDLVLARGYSGDSLQKAIRALIDAVKVEIDNERSASLVSPAGEEPTPPTLEQFAKAVRLVVETAAAHGGETIQRACEIVRCHAIRDAVAEGDGDAPTSAADWTNPPEKCPKCGAQLLVTPAGFRYCSAIRCLHVAIGPPPVPAGSPEGEPRFVDADSDPACTAAECGHPALCFMYPNDQHDGCPRQAAARFTPVRDEEPPSADDITQALDEMTETLAAFVNALRCGDPWTLNHLARYDRARAALDVIRRRSARGDEDTARLDWLEQFGGYVSRFNATSGWEAEAIGRNGEYDGATARDAIDRARSPHPGSPETPNA